MVLIVEINAPLTASLVNSHSQLAFFPLPAARVFYEMRGLLSQNLGVTGEPAPGSLE